MRLTKRAIRRIIKEEQARNVEHYMFFKNLQSIKSNVDKMLAMDEHEVDALLDNGHDWAADHIAVANTDIDQVAHFLESEVGSGEGMGMDYDDEEFGEEEGFEDEDMDEDFEEEEEEDEE